MVEEALKARPIEACGLLIGRPGGDAVERFEPVPNEATSAREFRLDGLRYVELALAAEDDGLDIIGIMHSHPTTPAVPSAHDTATATGELVPTGWHWVIVSLARSAPDVRAYRLSGPPGPQLVEETIHIAGS